MVLPTLLLPLILAAATDPMDKALADWDSDAGKAVDAQQAGLAKADERALKALEGVANAASRAGDIAAATAAWKEILRIDTRHAKAREFFAAAGTLDATIAEVTAPVDALGIPIQREIPATMPEDATRIRVGAQPGQEVPIGALKPGSVVLVQFLAGGWNLRIGNGRQSPDDADAPEVARAVIAQRLGPGSLSVLATIPAGSSAKPFAFVSTLTVADAVIALQPPARDTYRGEATYLVQVQP